MLFVNPTSIEVIIKDGKIEPLDPQQLPASGRGRLMILPAEETKPGPEPELVINEYGMPTLRAVGGPVITTEMVRRLEAEIPW